MGGGKNIAYVRVSTAEQNETRQKEALKKYDIDKRLISDGYSELPDVFQRLGKGEH